MVNIIHAIAESILINLDESKLFSTSKSLNHHYVPLFRNVRADQIQVSIVQLDTLLMGNRSSVSIQYSIKNGKGSERSSFDNK